MPDLAEDLISSGAEPVQADVQAIIKQLQDQAERANAQIAQLMAERGIPTDPIAVQLQALGDHVRAQSNANPAHSAEYQTLASYVGNLTSKNLTDKRGLRLRSLVEDLRAKFPGHELSYVEHLARDLHLSTLDDVDDDFADKEPVKTA